jgi:carbamoyltransferase
VALNCVANGKLLREKIFDEIWVQPASGDAGGALGAAMFVHHQLLDAERKAEETDSMQGALLGPAFEESTIREFLISKKIPHAYFDQEGDLLERVAEAISEGKVVGWFQGRMEYGPRALGARSILGDPRKKKMQSKMNLQIKFRESFRPFAPSVLKDDANTYFKFEQDSPYMMMVATVQESQQTEISQDDHEKMKDPNLIERVNIKRSTIPAVTHVDLSARIQTVDENRNRRYYHLIKRFKERTGCGVLINTSFNIRGEPIVCSPEDAYQCFMATDMDMLVLENFVLLKTEQSEEAKEKFTAHRNTFAPD